MSAEKCCSCFETFLVALTIASPLLVTGSFELGLHTSDEKRSDESVSHALLGENDKTGKINEQVRVFITVMLAVNSCLILLINISRNIQLEILMRLEKAYTSFWHILNHVNALVGVLSALAFLGISLIHDDTYPTAHTVISFIAFFLTACWLVTHTVLTIRSLQTKARCCEMECCRYFFVSIIMIVWTLAVCAVMTRYAIACIQHNQDQYYLYEWASIYGAVWYTPIIGFLFTQDNTADELRDFFCTCSRRRVNERCECVEQMPNYLVSV